MGARAGGCGEFVRVVYLAERKFWSEELNFFICRMVLVRRYPNHPSNAPEPSRLVASNEKAIGGLRTDMERLRAGIFIQMVGVVAAGVAVLGGFIAILQFLK